MEAELARWRQDDFTGRAVGDATRFHGNGKGAHSSAHKIVVAVLAVGDRRKAGAGKDPAAAIKAGRLMEEIAGCAARGESFSVAATGFKAD